MDMRRYLLVLDMDLLAMDEEHDLEPVSYLAARQEQEPCEVVVLSLVDTSQTKLPALSSSPAPVSPSIPTWRIGRMTPSASTPSTAMERGRAAT